MFRELEAHLHSEVNTLGYPKAVLFSICVALLAVVKTTLRVQHGEERNSQDITSLETLREHMMK